MNHQKHRRKNCRGASLVEFALVSVLFFLPLMLGASVFGLNLIRALQVTQLNRDASHMFSRGVDFSTSANRRMLLTLAGNLSISDSSGDGVIMLSTIQCTAVGQTVCTRRIVIGNAGLRSSSFVNPSRIDSSGNVDYSHDPSASANSLLAVLPMNPGEVAYVAETYFRSPDLNIAGFSTSKGIYARAIF